MALGVKTGTLMGGDSPIPAFPGIQFVGEYQVYVERTTTPIYFTGINVEQGKNYMGILYQPNVYGGNAIAFTGNVNVSGGATIKANIVAQDSVGTKANLEGTVVMNNLNKNISISIPSYGFQQGNTFKLALYEFTV